MGVFALLIIIPVLCGYAVFVILCLHFLKLKFSVVAIGIFVVSGAIAALASASLYGVLVADENDHLNGSTEILGLFASMGFSAISISLLSLIWTANKR